MNIVVCIKQVPDTTEVKFDPESGRIKREGLAMTINALDEYAVEEGLRIKEAQGGQVTALTMGPSSAVEVVKHAVAMGADEGAHLCDPALAGADSQCTAWALARAIVNIGGADLVLAGAETMDGATGAVGPAVAENLQIPCVTLVQKIVSIGEGTATVERMTESGCEKLEVVLPAVLTVVKDINEPRISSLKGKMRAKKYAPKTISVSDLGGAGAPGAATRVVRTFPPAARPGGEIFEGEPDEVAGKLFEGFKKSGLI